MTFPLKMWITVPKNIVAESLSVSLSLGIENIHR